MESEKAKSDRIARQREYYLKHRDKMLAYSRKYIKDHPEKQKLYRENEAKKRANGDTISATKKNCWKSLRAGGRITPKR